MQLWPGSGGASVAGAYLETSFSFGLQLTAAGVGFPLGPLEDHVRSKVNQGLLASMQEMRMERTLADAIHALVLRGASKIRELEHYQGKLFVDLVED